MAKGDGRGNPNIVEAGRATRFQPGNQLGGRPKLTPEQKALAISTRTQLSALIMNYMSFTLDEVETELKRRDLPAIDIAILRNLKKMHEDGSMERADWLLDHLMGGRAQKVEVKNTSPINLKNLNQKQLEDLKAIIEAQEKQAE